MAMIGTLPLEHEGNMHAGLALKLDRASSIDIETQHRNSTVRLARGERVIVCAFHNIGSEFDTIEYGTELIQEALDILSMSGRAHLATQDVRDEYMVWWEYGDEKILSLAFTWLADTPTCQISIEVTGGSSAIVALPSYTRAFRYFRLSQHTDDLFDAYRNMYLAFEYMLSERFPRQNRGRGTAKEFERDWIKRGLESAPELELLTSPLRADLTTTTDIIDVIYNDARLPLFHAKSQEVSYSPHDDPEQRNVVTNALSVLSHIVIRMADAWHNTRNMRQGWNLDIIKEANKELFDNGSLVCSPTKFTDTEVVTPDPHHATVVDGV